MASKTSLERLQTHERGKKRAGEEREGPKRDLGDTLRQGTLIVSLKQLEEGAQTKKRNRPERREGSGSSKEIEAVTSQRK